jgi:hypothetical protein
MTKTSGSLQLAFLAGLAVVLFAGGAAQLQAADLNLKALLIWGTDDQKPKDATFKEVEPELKKKLVGVFKWKNYFEITQKTITLSPKEPKKLRMSPKCELEISFADQANLDIKLFGEGRWTKTIRQNVKALLRGELAVLAGDDKDRYGDAWFVVISTDKKGS